MKLTEKIAYMKGLMAGMELDTTTKEGKAIAQMAEVMEEMAIYIDDLQSQLDEITELCDILDEDLGSVEEDLYCDDDDDDEDDFDDDEDDDEDDDDCFARFAPFDDDDYQIGRVIDPDDIDYLGDPDEEAQYEVECPSCHDTIIIDESILEEGSIVCPGCGEDLDFDYDAIIPSISDDADDDDGAEDDEPEA